MRSGSIYSLITLGLQIFFSVKTVMEQVKGRICICPTNAPGAAESMFIRAITNDIGSNLARKKGRTLNPFFSEINTRIKHIGIGAAFAA